MLIIIMIQNEKIEQVICKWLYSVDFKNINFYIKPDITQESLFTLNKYYPLNKNSIDALENNFFYINHPEDYNDPFECYKGFFQKKEIFRDYIDFFRFVGIVSFSNNDVNQLMWAHYSRHSGFVLKFDNESLKSLFHGPFPINYQEVIPDISYVKNVALKLFFSTNLKSNNWSYENEYRFLCVSKKTLRLPQFKNYELINSEIPEYNRYKHYDKSIIKEIILGYKFIVEDKYTPADRTLSLETNCSLKQRLLDFIIENKNISTYIIDVDSLTDSFSLKKSKVVVEYHGLIDATSNLKEYKFLIENES